MHVATLIGAHLDHSRNARRSRAGIEAQQVRKFRRLAAYAAQHSPYYRDIVARERIDVARCRVSDFPELTKKEITDRFDEVVTDRTLTRAHIESFLAGSNSSYDLFNRYYITETSGSSGHVAIVPYSFADWARGISQALRTNPYRPGRRRLAFVGATRGHFTGVHFATATQQSLLRFKYDIRIFDSGDAIPSTVQGLNTFRPHVLMAYPSAMVRLAEQQRDGVLRIAPGWVQTSGEPLHAQDQALIERAFGHPILSVYSSTEHLLMGMGTAAYGGTYLWEDDLIFEIRPDCTVTTNLFNYTLPLIRYRMSDILTPIEDKVRAFPFTKVHGFLWRADQTPTFTDPHGKEVPVNVAEILALQVNRVRRFQFQPTGKTTAEMRVCFEQRVSARDRHAALQEMRATFDAVLARCGVGNVDCGYMEVEDLLPHPIVGKFSHVLPLGQKAPA